MTGRVHSDDQDVASLFAIDRYDVGHVTAIDQVDGVRIVTDPRQWAHAIEFRPFAAIGFTDGPLRISVGLEVEAGCIEVGALSTTGSTFLSASTVGPGSHVIELDVPALARCQSITIRNAGPGASKVRVGSIAARRQAGVEAADGPDLSAPYGSSRRGFWDKNIFADIRRFAGADARVVFQVGAHLGEETSLFLQMFKQARVHCFEPAPTTVRALRHRFAGEDRTEVHEIALSDRPGVLPFHLNTRSETNSLFPFASARRTSEYRTASVIQVAASTVDEELDRMQMPLLDLLWLDTQGAELAILRGAARTLRCRQVRVLVAELTWIPLYEGQGTYYDVLHLLGHIGYGLYDLYNFHYSESGRLLWGDALFLPDAGAAALPLTI